MTFLLSLKKRAGLSEKGKSGITEMVKHVLLVKKFHEKDYARVDLGINLNGAV